MAAEFGIGTVQLGRLLIKYQGPLPKLNSSQAIGAIKWFDPRGAQDLVVNPSN
jgi:hypothetical protein